MRCKDAVSIRKYKKEAWLKGCKTVAFRSSCTLLFFVFVSSPFFRLLLPVRVWYLRNTPRTSKSHVCPSQFIWRKIKLWKFPRSIHLPVSSFAHHVTVIPKIGILTTEYSFAICKVRFFLKPTQGQDKTTSVAEFGRMCNAHGRELPFSHVQCARNSWSESKTPSIFLPRFFCWVDFVLC